MNLSIFQDLKGSNTETRRFLLLDSYGQVFMIVMNMVPVYLLMSGRDVYDIGWIYTTALMITAVLSFFVGKKMDTVKVNLGIGISWILTAVYCFLYSVAIGELFIYSAITAQIIWQLSFSFYPSINAYIHEAYPEDNREKYFTIQQLLVELGQIITFPVFGLILGILYPTMFAYRIVFFLCGIGILISAVLSQTYLPTVKTKAELKFLEFKKPEFDKKMKLLLSSDLLLVLGFNLPAMFVWINYIITKLNGTLFEVVLVEVVISAVTIIGAVVIKDEIKRFAKEMVVGGLLFYVAGYMVMYFSYNIYWVICSLAIISIGNICWWPVHNSLLCDYIDEKRRGEYFGMVSSLRILISIPIPFIAGFLASRFTPLTPYLLGLFFIIISIFIYLKIFSE